MYVYEVTDEQNIRAQNALALQTAKSGFVMHKRNAVHYKVGVMHKNGKKYV